MTPKYELALPAVAWVAPVTKSMVSTACSDFKAKVKVPLMKYILILILH